MPSPRPSRGDASPQSLEQDPRDGLVVAAAARHLDRAVQVRFAVGELLGKRKRKTGLHQNVETPAFDLRSLILWGFGDLGHEVPLLRSFVDEPCRSKFVFAGLTGAKRGLEAGFGLLDGSLEPSCQVYHTRLEHRSFCVGIGADCADLRAKI